MEGKNLYLEDPQTIQEKSVGADGQKVVDSDEEEIERAQKENEFELEFTFNEAKLAAVLPEGGSLVVCGGGAPKALFKIILDPDLSEVGKIEATEVKEDKTSTVATLWEGKGVAILFLDDVKGNYCSAIIDKIYGAVMQKNCSIVSLQSIYKTTYQTAEGLLEIDASKPYPMKYIKSSHTDAKINGMITSHATQITPDNALNFTGGLTAALVMEAEMMGRPAISLRCIVDQHCITTEMLQSYAPIVQLLNIPVDLQ